MKPRVMHFALLLLMAGAATAEESATPGEESEVPTIPVQPAERPGEAPPEDTSGTTLDTIEVTAQRRVSTLQETPISIEAFNAEKLQLRGIDGLAGLAANVPSMVIEPFPTHNATLRMFIRGVGTADAQVTQDPAVGIYIDGVYIARSVGLAVDVADLERIEVLRGPQGTLYGRNTTGGAINLITRKPDSGAFSASLHATGGDRERRLLKGSANIPLGDEFAVKIAALGTMADGFVENTGLGGDFSDRRETAARFDLRWLATDWLTADYAYDQTDLRYFNGQFQAVIPPNTNHGLGEYFKRYAQTQTAYSDRRLDSLATGTSLEPSRSKIRGHSLTLTAPLAGYELKYIGAYRRLTDDQYIDLGGGAGSVDYRLDTQFYDGPAADEAYGGPTPLAVPRVFQKQMSHEFQVTGSLLDDSLEYIVGGFDFREDGGENGHPLHHILNTYADPAAISASNPAFGAAFVGLSSPRLVAFWDYDYSIKNTAQAVFSQLTWSPESLDRRLHLTGGARYSRDRRQAIKNFIQTIYAEGNTAGGGVGAREVPRAATPGNDIFVDSRGERRYTDFSPSAIVRYDILKDATVYLSYSRAYKSGGFNVRDPQLNGDSGPASDRVDYGFGFEEGFKPEYVQSIELGLKSEWMGRRLRFNADVFDSRFTDMQTNFLIGGTISDTKTPNVGRARMRGLELNTTLVALPGLLLAFDYAYLDARVLEILDNGGNNVAHLYPFVSAPPRSYVGSVDWTFLNAGWGALRAYASYNYIGKRQGLIITEERKGLDLTAVHPFGLLNVRMLAEGLRMGERSTLELALWGKNLTDKEYAVFAIDNLPQADRAVLWGEARSLGLDLVYRFY